MGKSCGLLRPAGWRKCNRALLFAFFFVLIPLENVARKFVAPFYGELEIDDIKLIL
jgi:hypothetical protein